MSEPTPMRFRQYCNWCEKALDEVESPRIVYCDVECLAAYAKRQNDLLAAPRLPEGSTEPEPTSEAQLQGMLSDFRVEAVARFTHPTTLGRFRATVGADLLERRILAHVTDAESALTLAHSEIETLREAVKAYLAARSRWEHSHDDDSPDGRTCRLDVANAANALRTLTTETDT